MSSIFPCQTYFITDGSTTPGSFSRDKLSILRLIENAVDNNISMIQLREKQLTGKQVFELSQAASKITSGAKTKLLVNDRADIAEAADADGVHLASTSLPTATVRAAFPRLLIGVSTHSLETALAAKNGGADFLTFSPIFQTKSKIDYGEPQGLSKLTDVVNACGDFPVFALGGIDRENYGEALTAGAAGIAGISLFYEMIEGDVKL